MDTNLFTYTRTVVCTVSDWIISVHTTLTVVKGVKNKNPAFSGHVDLFSTIVKVVLRDEEHYNFHIPPDFIVAQGAVATLTNLALTLQLCPGNDSIRTSNTSSPANNSHPVLIKDENIWHDKLGIWIPNDLFLYVNDEPVYISKRQAKLKGQQHVPGSVYWLNGIRKRKEAHELALRQQKDREAREIARLAYEKELSARAKLWVPPPTV
ncbi:unnamed protein product [Rhizophagus irregularis]|nr:unnamed protein product [Rhizophagus irregularis]